MDVLSQGEPMLTGSHIYTVDPKGRVMLPRAFRDGLGQPFIVTRAPGPYLVLFSRSAWEQIIQRLRRGQDEEGEPSVLLRTYLGCASECHTDASTGRFLVPPALREHAGLRPGREAVVSGMGSLVEVWSKAQWDEALKTSAESLQEVTEVHLDLELPEPRVLPRFDAEAKPLLGIQILETRGHFNLQGAFDLRARLTEAEEASSSTVMVDLRRATGISTLTLQVLLAYHRRFRDLGRLFAVVLRPDDELLARERLPEVPVFCSLEAALWWAEAETRNQPPLRRLRRA